MASSRLNGRPGVAIHVQRPAPRSGTGVSSDWDAGRAFNWLLSEWEDTVWEFRTNRLTGINRIRWDRRLADGSKLTDPYRADLLETAKRFFAILMEDPADVMRLGDGHASVIQRTYILLTIIDWAVLRGRTCLADLTPADWEAYKERVAFGSDFVLGRVPKENAPRTTASAILNKFRVWQHLRDFYETRLPGGSRLLSDGLAFDPFVFPGDATALARQLGAETGRTRTIPPPTALHYLNAAIEYVATHSKDILHLRKHAKEAYERLSNATRSGGKRPTADETVRRLAAVLQPFVHQPELTPTYGGAPSRPALAARIGVAHTALYRNTRCARLMDLLTRHVAGSGSDRDTARELHEEINRILTNTMPQSKAPDKARVMSRVAAEIGLPFTGNASPGAPWPIEVIGSSPKNGRSLEAAVRHLWSACFLVIAAFMADRLSEVLETTDDCLDLDRPDGPYMRNVTWKDTNTAAGVASARPCPQIVAKAVEVALELGEDARTAMGSNKLFVVEHRGGFSLPDETTVRMRLEDFGRQIEVPPDELGDVWLISPHELRRFFAIAWVWNYELGGHLDALQQHLRHIDIETTIRYASEAVQGEMVGVELRDLTLHVLERKAFAGLDLSGALGEHFKRLFTKLRVRVGSPDELSRAVVRIVEKRQLVLRPSAWGYCGWSPGRAKYARCAVEAGVANPTGPVEWARTPETCDGCVNFATHSGFSPFWRRAAERHRAILLNPNAPPILVEAAREGLEISMKYLRDESASDGKSARE